MMSRPGTFRKGEDHHAVAAASRPKDFEQRRVLAIDNNCPLPSPNPPAS
jgi:hypothetical protein